MQTMVSPDANQGDAMADPLKNIIDAYVRGHDAMRRASVTVEATPDVMRPGRIVYRITGPGPASVQDAIDERMRYAEEAPGGGYANFTNPRGAGGNLWVSEGEVVTVPVTEAAE